MGTVSTVGFFRRILAKLFRLEVVRREGRDYLWRYHLAKGRWGGLYLHRFWEGDGDLDPHDHPWPFTTLILWGGYHDEQYEPPLPLTLPKLVKIQTCRPGRIYRRSAAHIHRVVIPPDVGAVWTLVLLGRKVRDWGFYTSTGWVHNTKYEKS